MSDFKIQYLSFIFITTHETLTTYQYYFCGGKGVYTEIVTFKN